MTPAQRIAQNRLALEVRMASPPGISADEPHEPVALPGSPDMQPTTAEEWAEIGRKAADLAPVNDGNPAQPGEGNAMSQYESRASAMQEAAMELAEYASYAEIVGGISVNRPQIREWCDKVFAANRALPADPASSEEANKKHDSAIDAAQAAIDKLHDQWKVRGLVRKLAESMCAEGIKAYDQVRDAEIATLQKTIDGWSEQARKKWAEVSAKHDQDLKDLHVAINAHQVEIATLREQWLHEARVYKSDLAKGDAEIATLRAALEKAEAFIVEETDKREDGCFEKDSYVWTKYVKPAQECRDAIRAVLARKAAP